MLNDPCSPCCCNCYDRLRLIEAKVNAILEILVNLQTGKAVDLSIVFGLAHPIKPTEGTVTMANKKATGAGKKCPCLAQKGKVGMVMPDLTLTSVPASITLQPLDASGNAVPVSAGDTVNGTLTSDSPNFVIAAGADSTHYGATIPANTPQGTVANLAATLTGTIQGAPADLAASVKLTLDIPPVPVAVDLEIILG